MQRQHVPPLDTTNPVEWLEPPKVRAQGRAHGRIKGSLALQIAPQRLCKLGHARWKSLVDVGLAALPEVLPENAPNKVPRGGLAPQLCRLKSIRNV